MPSRGSSGGAFHWSKISDSLERRASIGEEESAVSVELQEDESKLGGSCGVGGAVREVGARNASVAFAYGADFVRHTRRRVAAGTNAEETRSA